MIVAAVDKSERSQDIVEEAAAIAQAFDEPLHIVHVMSRSEFVKLERDNVDLEGEAVSLDEVRAGAASVAEDAGREEIEYEAIGLIGKAGEEIVRYASNNEADYIVVAPGRRSPAGKAMFGSVAQSVILNAECPVVAVP